jgi:hypothetical protein
MKRLVLLLVLPLVFLVLLLLVADFGARAYAQNRLSHALADSLEVSPPPAVSLGGFPFLIRILQGELPVATIRGTRLTAQGVPFQSVELHLRGVHFSLGSVLSGNGPVVAETGDGSATLTGPDLTAALHARGIPVTVTFASTGIRLSSPQLPGVVDGRLTLSDQKLILEPVSPVAAESFTLALPLLVRGVRYTGLRLTPSEAVLTVALSNVSVRIGSGS